MHHEFKNIVKKEWFKDNLQGGSGFKLMTKMQGLRNVIKTWNKNVFGNLDLKIKEAKRKIHEFELLN